MGCAFEGTFWNSGDGSLNPFVCEGRCAQHTLQEISGNRRSSAASGIYDVQIMIYDLELSSHCYLVESRFPAKISKETQHKLLNAQELCPTQRRRDAEFGVRFIRLFSAPPRLCVEWFWVAGEGRAGWFAYFAVEWFVPNFCAKKALRCAYENFDDFWTWVWTYRHAGFIMGETRRHGEF